MRREYIYILHFEEPLGGAVHYAGCTRSLENRMMKHAAGAGSRITRELKNRGIGWRIGCVAVCSHMAMREVERKLKDTHNLGRYCQVCNPDKSFVIPGSTMLDIELVETWIKTRSEQYKKDCSEMLESWKTLKVHFGLVKDSGNAEKVCEQIRSLMARDKDALGWIPIGGEGGLNKLIRDGRLMTVTLEEKKPRLIAYAAWSQQDNLTKVQQVCVADDMRLCGVGKTLIGEVREASGGFEIQCKVKETLAANEFWKSIGFHRIGWTIHHTSKSVLVAYSDCPLSALGGGENAFLRDQES